jgi:hypothetical protein
MNIEWDCKVCEELVDKLNDIDKKNILELKEKGGELMLLIDRVSLLINNINKSKDKNVYYIMSNELGLECIKDVMSKLND